MVLARYGGGNSVIKIFVERLYIFHNANFTHGDNFTDQLYRTLFHKKMVENPCFTRHDDMKTVVSIIASCFRRVILYNV